MAWDNVDFVKHFYLGGGQSKTLNEIGLLANVKSTSNTLAIDRPGGFKDQIRNKAREIKEGAVNISFDNSYSFSDVKFAMGSGTLRGNFVGTCSLVLPNKSHFTGKISIEYSDSFTDPLSVIEKLYGSSDSPNAPDWLKAIGNVGGTAYGITGQWNDDFSGDVEIPT